MKLPFLLSAGKGLKLIVLGSKGGSHKQIIISGGVWIGDNVELNTEDDCLIVINEGASLQDRCKIIGNVTIHRNAILAPNVFISSGTHQAFLFPHLTIREQDSMAQSLNYASQRQNILEEDCWIGINTFIKAGVYVGRGSVIGANSIISKDIPPYSVVVGANKFLAPRFLMNPTSKLSVTPDFTPYFYRGFCSKKGFWLPDNLSVLRKGSYSRLLISFDSSSEGIIQVLLSSKKQAEIRLLAHTLTYDVLLSESSTELKVPKTLENYECIKITYTGKDSPRFKTLEFLE